VKIDMCDADGRSIFGAIEQRIVPPGGAAAVPEPSPEQRPEQP
jgi:hypothetical protein